MQENTKSVVVKMTARRCFRTEPIYQYDVGHVLAFEGFELPTAFEVHFARSPLGKAVTQIGTDGTCTLPDMFAQTAGVIYAWLYIVDADSRLTKYSIEIPVARRAKPTNQEPTPVQESAIDQAIAALNTGVEAAEDAQEAAEAAQASAESYAEGAGQSAITATNAANSATSAKTAAETAARNAAASATDANASRQAADQSATNAGVSERNAAASASAAAGSATSAATSAGQASASATAASGSASTASTKASEAAQSATAAAGSAASASEDAGTASTAATAAGQSATAAAGSATAAAGSATSAGQSATAAAGSAQAAQDVLDSIPADYSELSGDVNSLKSAINDITKEEIIGTGYGINIKENGIGTVNISGNVLQNAYIRKCGKNLFDKEGCDSTTDFVANSTKYYQPFVPIFLVPGKTYKVTFTVKDRETYNETTWSNKQWVSNDPNTIQGINSSEFANIDTKTVSFTVGDSGCLYFVNVWDEQTMLDKFFTCFDVMIVESGVYADETTFVSYSGSDVSFSDTVDATGCENLVIHRAKSDANLQTALPEATISWYLVLANAEADIAKEKERTDRYVDMAVSKCQPVPLFIDPIAGYNWVSMYEVSAFSSNNPTYADGTTDGNNGYFAISGTSGDDYVTIITGGNADISVLTSTEKARWLGGVLIDDDGNATPCNFFYKTDTQFYVYPALTKSITSGQLAGIQTGMHLSKRGFKGYAQALWNINPKHCEKSKYIRKYRVGDNIPFSVYGGKVGASVDTRNLPTQYQNKYATSTYVLNMDWGSAQFHNTETGIEWSVNISGYSGYFEAYVGDSGKGVTTSTVDSAGSAYSFDYGTGAEVHCELYVDGVLKDSYIKKSKKLERVCLDYSDGENATVKIYSSKWQETGHGFSVGAMTWWVNERWDNSEENPYAYKAITQLFDSWGVFQTHAVQTELESLHSSAIGTPVPINNKSLSGMTSQWGRLWFYDYVQQENTTVMMTDFGINDYNSSISTLQDETAPDGSTWPVSFTMTSYAESIGKLIKMATKNNIMPIVIGLGYRNAGAIVWAQAAIDAQAVRV